MPKASGLLFILASLLLVIPEVSWPGVVGSQNASYDLVIRNGRVVDGTGNVWYRADVAIRGDTIAKVATSISDPATRVIDAAVRSSLPDS